MKTQLPITLILCWLLYLSTATAQDRSCDPVVLTGQELPCMLNEMPEDIVAFKFIDGNGWVQIPMQVDERIVKEIDSPYDPAEVAVFMAQGSGCLRKSFEDVPWDVLFYADARTHVGADTDLAFDADDELVFMQQDAGDLSTATAYPTGTVQGSICEVAVTEPLSNDAVLGYVYLFMQDGSLDQAAGMDYVSYSFNFENNYLTDYVECKGNDPNTNAGISTIESDNYELGFSQTWQEDVLKIKAGNATAQDILDVHQMFINAGSCGSTEQGFSANENAHIAFIDGPVRAIRSIMGTSSGPLTQLNILATNCQVDYRMNFRLHPANGFNDVYDLNQYAKGKLTYYSERNQAGVAVDGNDDAMDKVDPDEWALYEGNPGSLIISWDYETDMIVGTSSTYQNGNGSADCDLRAYYDDDGAGASHKCTGDGQAIGSSGFVLRTKQCTDRRYDWNQYVECRPENVHFMNIRRLHYFKPPGMTVDSAIQYDQYAKNPLSSIVTDGTGVVVTDCPEKQEFQNETLTTDLIYQVSDTISTDGMVTVPTNTTIVFDAGKAVILKEGFSAANGSTFTAKIGGCAASVAPNVEKRSIQESAASSFDIFPNPMRQQATLVFDLAKQSNCRMLLFDVNGRLVSELMSATVHAEGNHSYEFDASSFQTGLYLMVLQTEEEVISRSISIVK